MLDCQSRKTAGYALESTKKNYAGDLVTRTGELKISAVSGRLTRIIWESWNICCHVACFCCF